MCVHRFKSPYSISTARSNCQSKFESSTGDNCIVGSRKTSHPTCDFRITGIIKKFRRLGSDGRLDKSTFAIADDLETCY